MFRAADLRRVLKRQVRRARFLKTASVEDKDELRRRELAHLRTIRECDNEDDARVAIAEMEIPFDSSSRESLDG